MTAARGAVVVTGGARGIGAAIAQRLAADGQDVVVLDRDPAESASEPDPGHGRILAIVCDITDEASVRDAMATAVERFGGIAGLVNNAGVTAFHDPVEMTQRDWSHVFGVDLMSAWLCAKHAIPAMRMRDGAAIVNVSSIHARLTIAGMFPYAAAKAGLEGLTRSLALDLAADGIRVNAVAPGYVRTEMSQDWIDRQPDPAAAAATVHAAIPLGRMAEPDEIASVVQFLLAPASSAITGAVIPVDCGLGVRFSS